MLFCCTRNAGFEPANGACQAPHSSTTRLTFFSGSYLSTTASCLRRNSSMNSVDFKLVTYSSSPNFSDFVDGRQPFGTVYQCSETPLMSQAHVCFFHAFMTASVHSVFGVPGPTAIFSIWSLLRCAGFILSTKRLYTFIRLT